MGDLTISGDITLLQNALQMKNTLPVTSRRLDGIQYELQFAVRDTGICISRDRMSRPFKSFSQVDSSMTRQWGGSGLGLAISKRLSELMGGTMWAESEQGAESPFFFNILASSTPTAARHFLLRVRRQRQLIAMNETQF